VDRLKAANSSTAPRPGWRKPPRGDTADGCAPVTRILLETARLQADSADQAINDVQAWSSTAEPQDHASTLAALRAGIAADMHESWSNLAG
jgi:hypothetical protein